jgi:hypothetical protein
MLEDVNSVEELLDNIKKHTLSFSKFYSKISNKELSQFIHKDKETQSMILDTIYENNSKLEQLLREIIEYDVNAETLRLHEEGAETEERQEYQD